jgi:two-component system phosphate regulon sensor histidine kinase PhoR
MNLNFLVQKTLFSKVFIVFILVVNIPLLITGLYGYYVSDGRITFPAIVIFLIVALGSAASGSFYLYKSISHPITQFARSATEIARGNFTHRVDIISKDELGRLAKIFNYMVTELQRLIEMNLNKIITEKNKTETIIKNIADGIIVTDPDDRILVFNSVAEKWFGVREPEVQQHPIENVIHNEALISLIKRIKSSSNGNSSALEIQLRSPKSHKNVILQANAARVIRSEQELIGIVTILRDITREREIDRMKTELVSMVAHELRSPLTSISGFSELLLDSSLSETQAHEYAQIILNESSRLGDLINKFLDISRIESGKSQMKKTSANMYEIVMNVLAMNIHLAERRAIQVNIAIPYDLPEVFVDKEMIGQVLLNLFTNAVKYSPEKTIIEINGSADADYLSVQVADQGYGISEQSLPKIFDKFYRVTDNEKVKEVTGSGLGLSLVKEIIESHGGTVTVTSRPGQGSTFTIKLPLLNEKKNKLEMDDNSIHEAIFG